MEQIVDPFTGPAIDDTRWQFLTYPLADGASWICQEPAARTVVGNGKVRIEVDRFQNAYGGHQNIDNCKHLYVARETLPVAPAGLTGFHCDITAHSVAATPRDYRDGFVSFNVLDFTTGMVFDVCATGDQLFAIYERLPFPGIGEPFTAIIEAPLSGLTVRPGETYRSSVLFDARARTAEWWVNERRIFAASEVPVPNAVTLGFGFISLHPCVEGQSRSLHGQGLHGSWARMRRSHLATD